MILGIGDFKTGTRLSESIRALWALLLVDPRRATVKEIS